jgi:hypothetical protein
VPVKWKPVLTDSSAIHDGTSCPQASSVSGCTAGRNRASSDGRISPMPRRRAEGRRRGREGTQPAAAPGDQKTQSADQSERRTAALQIASAATRGQTARRAQWVSKGVALCWSVCDFPRRIVSSTVPTSTCPGSALGALRVRASCGMDPIAKRRRYLTEVVPRRGRRS